LCVSNVHSIANLQLAYTILRVRVYVCCRVRLPLVLLTYTCSGMIMQSVICVCVCMDFVIMLENVISLTKLYIKASLFPNSHHFWDPLSLEDLGPCRTQSILQSALRLRHPLALSVPRACLKYPSSLDARRAGWKDCYRFIPGLYSNFPCCIICVYIH